MQHRDMLAGWALRPQPTLGGTVEHGSGGRGGVLKTSSWPSVTFLCRGYRVRGLWKHC